jgi:hypothetical protein
MENHKSKPWLLLGLGGCLLGGLLVYMNKERLGEKSETSLNLRAPAGIGTNTSEEPTPSDSSEIGAGPTKLPKAYGSLSKNATTPEANLTPEDRKKWEILQEILASQNDNDPRLDKAFKGMTDELHSSIQERYHEIPEENRNQRGLLAFLIARDLKSTDDLDFLKKIYEESPCLSLENCGTRTSSDPHLSGVDEASLNYPQLASLYQLEKQLNENPSMFSDPTMKDHAKAVIDQALRFPVSSVQKKAAEIQARF